MSDLPYLAAEIRHSIGAVDIDAVFQLASPWTILFGPSGSGKSTILRILAGLLESPLSRISLNSADVSTIPAHRRAIRMAFQKAALFPHKTVQENIAFASAGEVDAGILDLFRIGPLASRYPHQISGGEAQRVSLARLCAAADTKLLLLDEPFTGLDLALRSDLLHAVRAWAIQRSIPVLSVTHDVTEALQLGAEVMKLQQGRVAAKGPAADVLSEERSMLLTQMFQG